MNKGNRPRSGFPGKRSLSPALLVVAVVVWIGDARPANQRWLDTFASPRGKIEKSDSFRRQQPLMTSPCSDIHKLGLHVEGYHSECLNHVDYQKRVMIARDAPNSLEVGTKP